MEPGIVALVSAAVGAGGAVAAQAVSSTFAARRDRARLDWEQSRATAEDAKARAAAFVDVKRAAFVRILSLAKNQEDLVHDVHFKSSIEQEDAVARYQSQRDSWWSDWNDAVAEATLLEPLVDRRVRELGAFFARWDYEIWDEPGAPLTMDSDPSSAAVIEALRVEMRRSLGIATDPVQ